MGNDSATSTGDFEVELKSILSRERPLRYFADDDFEEWVRFTKKRRQDLSRLLYQVPGNHSCREKVLNEIKLMMTGSSISELLVWYRSDLSGIEVAGYAKKVLLDRLNGLDRRSLMEWVRSDKPRMDISVWAEELLESKC